MRVYLTTLGCRLNEAELEGWSRDFQQRGHRISADPGNSDLLVVNTCAVTAEAARKSRKILQRAHRNNPHAKLVVSGCYSTLDPQGAASLPGIDLIVPNERKDQLVAEAERCLDLHSMPVAALDEDASPLLTRGRHRAFIKIQDGCRYQCTFCVVTTARGQERSRGGAEICAEINRFHAEGIQEVVLTGVHLGGYGSDQGSDLTQLLIQILKHTEIPRIRLGALEPWDLPAGFWELFHNPRVMPHLHLPLQSGSDDILRRMARRCKVASFSALVEEARGCVPGFNITSDIIVGFPGETDRHWHETLSYVEQANFGHLHIFAFSPRPGTLAAAMDQQLPKQVIKERSAQLHQLASRMKQVQLQQQVGSEVQVLLENPGSQQGRDELSGYTPHYYRVLVPCLPQLPPPTAAIRPLRIIGVEPQQEALIGELV